MILIDILLACTPESTNPSLEDSGFVDQDSDGIEANLDCDDTDPSLKALSEDADCDRIHTEMDCDDQDPMKWTEFVDVDCDGHLNQYVLTTGWKHTCALNILGTTHCWGDDEEMQTSPPENSIFTHLHARSDHSCGITQDRQIECWGNDYQEINSTPDGDFIQVSTSGYHVCAINSEYQLQCWGSNTHGESTPPAGRYTDISVFQNHSK